MYKKATLNICIFMIVTGVATPVLAGLNDGLVAYFKLDETEGTFAADSSGNGNHGTLVGSRAQWVPGYFDGGVDFATDEAEAHVEFPTTGMSVTSGSISIWGNLRNPQATRTRYFFGHTTRPPYSNRIQIYMDGSTTNLDIGLGGSHAARTDIMMLPMGTWIHVVLTWDNGVYAVYVNGEKIANGSYSGLTALDPVANVSDDSNPAESEAFDGILDEARIYNRAITAEEVMAIYTMLPPSRTKAQAPRPDNEAVDVPADAALTWTASEMAATHDVYLGTVYADVNDASRADPRGVLAGQDQADTAYDPEGLLEYGKTYFWRIDEVNAAPDSTVFQGDVWSFTVEPFGYPIANVTATASSSRANMGPENTVNGSGLNAADEHSTNETHAWMSAGTLPNWVQYEFDQPYKLHELWVWNSNQMIEAFIGFGAKDVTIEYSTDGATWTALEGVPAFAQATGAPTYKANTVVDFGGVTAKYVKLTINQTWGGVTPQTGLSEVRFFYVPVQAFGPQPAAGATDIAVDEDLNWRPGREATAHTVYFGTDQAAVAGGTVTPATATEHSHTPGALDFATTYYWKVDETGDTGSYAGNVWSFTTQEFATSEDFESYNDDDNRIYDSWIDGLTTGASGSQIGYDVSPFAERFVVHGGKQSMPFLYDNENSPFYSETEREFATAQNWTAGGANSLSLWVQDAPANLYVIVQDSAGKSATATRTAATPTGQWTQWVVPFSDLAGVNMSRVKKLTLGVGNKAAPAAGGAGTFYVDDLGFGRPLP